MESKSKKGRFKGWLGTILTFAILGFPIFVILMAAIFGIFFSSPKVTFHDGSTKVTLERKLYHPRDTVELKVEAEAWLRVEIISIELESSVKGLENVTLYSGGKPYWGSAIVYTPPGSTHTDTQECDFVLPLDLQIMEDTTRELYFTIEIKYVHPREARANEFYNDYETESITINLNVEKP
jgi:hypothetical protein